MPNINELEIGLEVVSEVYHLTRDSLVRYAGASGDFNPIHYRDDIAQSVGLPGVLAHGMLTMGVSIAPVLSWIGDPAKVVDYGVRFTKPVLVPASGSAELRVSAKIGQIDQENSRVRVDITTEFEGNTVLGKSQAWVQL
jgi:acyl dehydratase